MASKKDFVGYEQVVLVVWHDAEAQTGWGDPSQEDIDTEALVQSIGWIVAENEHTLLLAADTSVNDENVNRTMRIPLACIKDIYPIKLPKVTTI